MPSGDAARQAVQAARAGEAGGAATAAVDVGQPLAAPRAGSGGGGGKSLSGSSSDVRSSRICAVLPCLGLPGALEAYTILLA